MNFFRAKNVTEKVEDSNEISAPVVKRKTNALENVLDYFIHQQGNLLMKLQMNRQDQSLREQILSLAREQFVLLNRQIEKKELDRYLSDFEKYVWGYYLLNDLLDAKNVSDIKCYAHDHVRMKKSGKRQDANVRFRDADDYKRFVNMIATKNEINLSNINAVVHFGDATSHPDFILRFDISTEYVNCSNIPFVHIRKTPKKKKTIEELVRRRFMTQEQAEYLCNKVMNESSMFFVGKGGAGKTTLMNALLEKLPLDVSGVVIQWEDELYSNHPDLLFQHIREVQGEGKVQYGMDKLARNALRADVDYYILGEITGNEAAAFSTASYTGHTCWASGHGQNEEDGLSKLADYTKLATGHEYKDCLKMLTGMEVCVFLKGWQVKSISEVKGYDAETGRLIVCPVDIPAPTEPPIEEE